MKNEVKNLKICNTLKNNVLGFVLGGLVAGSVSTIWANTIYESEMVLYKDNKTVKDEIDSLYSKYSETKMNIIYLGTGSSFDLTSYENYERFTVDNFIVGSKNLSGTASCIASNSVYAWGAGWVSTSGSCTASVSATISSVKYDSETGILTIKATNCTPFVYLVQGQIQAYNE